MKNNMITITKKEITLAALMAYFAYYFTLPYYFLLFPITIILLQYVKYLMDKQQKRNSFYTFFRHLKVFAENKDLKVSGLIIVLAELIVWAFNKNITWYVAIFLAAVPLDVILRFFYLEHFNDIIIKKLFNKYDDKIIFVDNINGKLTLKSSIPLDLTYSDELQLCTNTTILHIKQDICRKQIYTIRHGKGIEVEYRKMAKNSEMRLTSILKSYGDIPMLESIISTEIDDRITYQSKLGIRRINNLLPDIEHKLGCNKDMLSIEYVEGKVIFAIKMVTLKQYYIDNIIPYTKRGKSKVPYIAGIKRQTGEPFVFDLIKTGHFLLGGMTGSGKSSTLHSILQSSMYWNDDIYYFMIDLKGNELPDVYGKFSNCSVVGLADGDTLQDSINLIKDMFVKVDEEYNHRIRLFKKHGVKDITGYNSKYGKLPYILVVVDEANAIFETIQKKNKQAFQTIEGILDNLFARGRSTGMFNCHTMQQIRDGEYCISWRRAMMTRICMKMREVKQCQMVLESTPELADKASKQTIGEFILGDYNSNYFELQNIRVDDNGKDKIYRELKNKYVKENKNVRLEKDSRSN